MSSRLWDFVSKPLHISHRTNPNLQLYGLIPTHHEDEMKLNFIHVDGLILFMLSSCSSNMLLFHTTCSHFHPPHQMFHGNSISCHQFESLWKGFIHVLVFVKFCELLCRWFRTIVVSPAGYLHAAPALWTSWLMVQHMISCPDGHAAAVTKKLCNIPVIKTTCWSPAPSTDPDSTHFFLLLSIAFFAALIDFTWIAMIYPDPSLHLD